MAERKVATFINQMSDLKGMDITVTVCLPNVFPRLKNKTLEPDQLEPRKGAVCSFW